jgi:hypothetical protein
VTALAGEDLVEKGLGDLKQGLESVEALLVSIHAPRLERLGFPVSSPIESPEERLCELLAQEDSESAPARYNELVRRLVSFERQRAGPRRVDRAASRLCDVNERVLNEVRQPVWGADWEVDDEDWLRDTAHAVERYRHWAETGEDDFILLRPSLEPQIALADQMLTGIGYLLRSWEEYGDPLDPALRRELDQAAKSYWQIRQEEGGPGSVNVSTWSR